MNNKTLWTAFAILVTTLGAATLAGLAISSVTAQEDNGTLAGNLTAGAANMTDTNATNGTGNISGAEDPF